MMIPTALASRVTFSGRQEVGGSLIVPGTLPIFHEQASLILASRSSNVFRQLIAPLLTVSHVSI